MLGQVDRAHAARAELPNGVIADRVSDHVLNLGRTFPREPSVLNRSGPVKRRDQPLRGGAQRQRRPERAWYWRAR